MAKINQEEYEVLKELDDKWKWIARDGECNSINVFSVKPIKVHSQWDYEDVDYKHAGLTKEENKMFQFIKWEDEEPYNIQELILEYERDRLIKLFSCWSQEVSGKISEGMKNIGLAINESLSEESEETEVKNIEWLKSAIQQNLDFYNDKDEEWQMAKVRAYAKSLDLINQLDEPEVLSQELPVIPKFVADWIEEVKKQNNSMVFAIWHIYDKNEIGESPNKEENRLFQWMELADNDEVFARAWLDGFTVEEEQKYVVRLPMSKNNDNKYAIVDYLGDIWIDALPSKYKLTEEEIRGLTKGDILFEHFATKVEELEEL